MSRKTSIRRILTGVVGAATVLGLVAACGGNTAPGTPGGDDGKPSAGGDITLEFMQWWEPELPAGSFRALMDDFEEKNPGIKVELLSGPWSATKEQLVAGAVAGTMPDVVGLDGSWLYDLVQQGSIASLTDLMTEFDYDASNLAKEVQLDGTTYMIPVVNFVYPMFVNNELLGEAGVAAPPETRTEFLDAAKKISALGDNTSGWALPLSLETGNGVQNDVMPWVWAGGGSMLDDAGKPDLENAGMVSGAEFVKELWDSGTITPGAFTMKEPDKVEEFVAGRVGMMISSLAHVNMIRKENPDLDFTVTAVPAPDDFTGKRGINDNSWGVGVSESSDQKEAAFKLVEFLMSEEVNSELSTIANGFPGNVNSVPDFSQSDPLFEEAFKIYQAGYPANQFVGLPVAEELMRIYATELQRALDGQASITDALAATQEQWTAEFK